MTDSRTEICIGGRRIEAVQIGGDRSQPPLVLLHEGLGSVGLWRDFPAALQAASGRRVIAYSRFGHGASDPPPKPRTPAFFHEEALDVLPAVVEAFGAEGGVLVGHSDGASIALVHAAHHEVAALVLLAPHVVVEDISVSAIAQTRRRYLDEDLRPRLARYHRNADAAFWGWCDVWLDPAFRAWSLEPEVRRVTAPTLLIQSRSDPYGTLRQLDLIEAWTAGKVERLVVTGGHSPHLEVPELVTPAIAAFVRG